MGYGLWATPMKLDVPLKVLQSNRYVVDERASAMTPSQPIAHSP
jgi:hypothetical protein